MKKRKNVPPQTQLITEHGTADQRNIREEKSKIPMRSLNGLTNGPKENQSSKKTLYPILQRVDETFRDWVSEAGFSLEFKKAVIHGGVSDQIYLAKFYLSFRLNFFLSSGLVSNHFPTND